MKMRIFSLTALVLLMLSVTAQALEPQATGGNPVLTFSGTTAQCSITCTGNKSTDQVEAKLTLYQGGAYVDSWDGSGKFRQFHRGGGKGAGSRRTLCAGRTGRGAENGTGQCGLRHPAL